MGEHEIRARCKANGLVLNLLHPQPDHLLPSLCSRASRTLNSSLLPQPMYSTPFVIWILLPHLPCSCLHLSHKHSLLLNTGFLSILILGRSAASDPETCSPPSTSTYLSFLLSHLCSGCYFSGHFASSFFSVNPTTDSFLPHESFTSVRSQLQLPSM